MGKLKRELGIKLHITFKNHSIELAKKNESAIAKAIAPKDDIERAFLHYQFIRLNYPKILWLISQVVALLMIFPKIIKYRKNSSLTVPADHLIKSDAVIVKGRVDRYDNIIPKDIESRYGRISEAYSLANNSDIGILEASEMNVIRECWKRHPFSPKYLLQIIEGLALYAYIIRRNNPSSIVTYASEDSCRASVLTAYCESKGVKHIDFMHGERFYGYTQAFMRFNVIYVWSQSYVELFLKSGIKADEYIIYIPQEFVPVIRENDVARDRRVTYYLSGDEKKKDQEVILSALKRLEAKGMICILRPHPRFSDIAAIKQFFCDFEIEDYAKVSIEQSLARTGFAVSKYSTVLLQAWYSQIPIIVDDISDPKQYELLEYVHYWGLEKRHALLSDFSNSQQLEVPL